MPFYKGVGWVVLTIIVFFLWNHSSFAQQKAVARVKSFVTTAPDTVTQGKDFTVEYILTASGWDKGGSPLQGNGFRVKSVNYTTRKATPFSQLVAKVTYFTSGIGELELPGMQVFVNKKSVYSAPKSIYVKPDDNHGEEMAVAYEWLLNQGISKDSLCLDGMIVDYKGVCVFWDYRHPYFCIVAKKESWPLVGNPVLAFSTEGTFGLSILSECKEIFKAYEQQINALGRTVASNTEHTSTSFYTQKNNAVAPMLNQLRWGQNEPYNINIPLMSNGKKPVVGCVPLAVAMVMDYYQWPKETVSHSYYKLGEKIFKMDFQGYRPEWDNFQNQYAKEDTTGCDKLAVLLAKLGFALDADFNSAATSASLFKVKGVMCNNLGYSGKMTINTDTLSDEETLSIIYKELDEGRPLIVSYPGHAFICDGYQGDYVHFNFGWHGTCNGFYRMKIGNYNGNKNLLAVKNLLFGIEPQRDSLQCNVDITNAGTLKDLLTEAEKYSVTCLTISGPLNSDDIRFLRMLAGATTDGNWNNRRGGNLRVLDLSKARIISDKNPYLTQKATGGWRQWSSNPLYGSNVIEYNFDHMDEDNWKKFKSNVGAKQDGLFYTRTSDNRYWVNYNCRKDVIGKSMFDGCNSLTTIILPESTTFIDDYAFSNCWSLKAMKLPPKVREIGKIPFYHCYSLELLEVPQRMKLSGVLCEDCSPILTKVQRY